MGHARPRSSRTAIAERDHLRNPAHPLEEDVSLASLVAAIDNELARYFSRATSLKLRLTTTDSAGVLASIYPHYRGDHGFVVPSRREGTGLVSLQKLALLMQFGHVRVQRGDNFIMAMRTRVILSMTRVSMRCSRT
jgi:putative ATP-dependent endonuclease of the OLD family